MIKKIISLRLRRGSQPEVHAQIAHATGFDRLIRVPQTVLPGQRLLLRQVARGCLGIGDETSHEGQGCCVRRLGGLRLLIGEEVGEHLLHAELMDDAMLIDGTQPITVVEGTLSTAVVVCGFHESLRLRQKIYLAGCDSFLITI